MSADTEPKLPTPNPGSREAQERGCLCPILDNARGRGAWGSGIGTEPMFFITESCPLHWKESA